MSDGASAPGAAGSSSGASDQANQTSAGERSPGGSGPSNTADSKGTGTERTPNGERSASRVDAKDQDRKDSQRTDAKPDPKAAAKPSPASDTKAKPTDPFAGTKHKIRVDGKDVEVDYDDLKRRASHSTAAADRMKQTAEYRKTAEPMVNAIESFKNGDAGPLVELVGIDAAEEFAEAILKSRVEYDELSDEEKEIQRLKHENQGYKSKEQKAAEAAKAKRVADAEAVAAKQINTEIAELLQQKGRKSTPRMVARAVEYMLAHLEQSKDQSRLTSADAFDRVRQDMSVEIPEYLEGMSPEELVEVLPESVLDALEKHFVKRARAANPFGSSLASTSTDDDVPNPKTPPKRHGTGGWFAEKERKYGGK